MEALGLHTWTGLPLTPGHRPWLLHVEDHPSLVPPPVPQQATAASSSPPSTLDQAKVVCFPARPTGEGDGGAGKQQLCYRREPWLALHPAGFLWPLLKPCIRCGALLHSCCRSTAVQGHLCFLCAIKGSAAGRISCVCSNKLSSARAHHWT